MGGSCAKLRRIAKKERKEKSMIKIFHCGDIHLDAPFSGISPAEGRERRNSLCTRFLDMLDFAKKSRADIVLISGDLFDSGYVRAETEAKLIEAFSALDCPIVIAPGNHDPFTPDSIYASALPENVYVFDSEECSRFDFDDIGVSVTGYAFTSEAHPERPLADTGMIELSESNLNLLCAHTDIFSPVSTYAPISENELAETGFAYAALSHVHKSPEIFRFGGTYAAYSGFAEGRGFDECGEGGAWLITAEQADGGGIKLDFERVCTSRARYAVEKVDITGADSDAAAAAVIDRVIGTDTYPADVALRIILEGEVAMSYTPSAAAITKLTDISAKCEIKDMTEPLYDAAYLENDLTVKGEFYRLLAEKLSSGSAAEKRVAAEALRYGLAAMSARDIVIDGD